VNLTKSLQKADPKGKVTATANATAPSNDHGMSEMVKQSSSSITMSSSGSSTQVSVVKGAATLSSKAFSPSTLKIKVGSTVTWINNDNNIHTITSGKPNTPNAGEMFDSGLTALIMPAKTFSHKFTDTGKFSYFCRLHPTMTGEIEVVP
jgi:nitrite reductase (NO-forming)